MSREDILTLVRNMLADILDNDDLVLTEATTADEVDGWDSINHVRLLIGIESELKIRFDTEDLADLKNVGALIDLIQEKMK